MNEIIVPADIYDYHELVSEAYGGVGRGFFKDDYGNPCCIVGQRFFSVSEEEVDEMVDEDWYDRLYDVYANDMIVYNAIEDIRGRISWQRYCELRNIKRGT